MTQAVSISIPVHSPWVPRALEAIIDKKVQGIALNCLDQLVDWSCTVFYWPYRILSEEKMSRVHYFSDYLAKMYDCTKNGIAGMLVQYSMSLTQGRILPSDSITLYGDKVHLHENPFIHCLFSRRAHTDYVVVRDLNDHEIEILEQETPRSPDTRGLIHRWTLDLDDLDGIAQRVYWASKVLDIEPTKMLNPDTSKMLDTEPSKMSGAAPTKRLEAEPTEMSGAAPTKALDEEPMKVLDTEPAKVA